MPRDAETFTTHSGEVVSGGRYRLARGAVADEWRALATAIRAENAYASHVADAQKDENLRKMTEQSDRIRSGTEPIGFWLWQRINEKLTGDCVAMLP